MTTNKLFTISALFATLSFTTSCSEMQKMKQQPVTTTEDIATATEENPVEAPVFQAESLNGETIRLTSFPHKYIVLDFWGTWCGYCVKGIPQMKAYYEKYADQMEIIGVDSGDDEMDLRDFIKSHEMDWTHILNDDDDPDGSLVARYGVTGFPTKVIIDPDGFIIGTYVGEVQEFYDKLDEVLK